MSSESAGSSFSSFVRRAGALLLLLLPPRLESSRRFFGPGVGGDREVGPVPRGQPAPAPAGWPWPSSGAFAVLPRPGLLFPRAPVPPRCPPPGVHVPPRRLLVHGRPPRRPHLAGTPRPRRHQHSKHIRLATLALLDTFESFPGATLRLVFRHIDTAPASPELTSAAHALVDVLRSVHTAPGRFITWPDSSTPGAAASASSPRRHHGASSPRHGRRDHGRQGRSTDNRSSSSQGKRTGQKKNRRDDSSRGGSSSSSAPARRTKLEKEEPADSDDVKELKTPRQVTPSLVDISSSDKLRVLSSSEFATDRALPLPSATAHARQEQINEINNAADNAYIRAVQRH